MTGKGRLTVPKAVQDGLGLHGPARVRFEADLELGTATLVRVPWTAEDLASFAVPGARKMGFEEMEEAIRKGTCR